jgi:hypothetical protein
LCYGFNKAGIIPQKGVDIMKKKFLVTLIVVCVLLPAALSAAIADLSIGAIAMYNTEDAYQQFSDGDFDGLMEIENYTFGADLRIKLLLAEVDVVGMYGQETFGSTTYHELSTLVTGGVSFDLLGLARIGLGLGPRFLLVMDENNNFYVFDSDNNPVLTTNAFGDAFIKSPVAYRATVDFNLGSIMLGLNYTVDSEYTFEKYGEINKLFESDATSGKFGVSLLFSLL